MSADLKPYPAMKDSGVPWLGEVPEHWKQLPGRACYRERHVPNTGLIETTVLSLSYGRIVVKPVDKLHGLVPASFETYQIVTPGDIIIRPTDLQNDWNSLRFSLSHNRGIITSAYLCFHTTDLWTREYGHLLLHTYDLSKVFYGLGSGLRQNLDWTDFKYLPCLVPPLHEQATIVRFLDHADRRIRRYIRAKQQLIALLEEQKQAIIHQAVTGQIDVRTGKPYQAYKPSGVEWLGDVPAHWEIKRLKSMVPRIDQGVSPQADNYLADGTAWGVLKAGCVNRGVFRETEHKCLAAGFVFDSVLAVAVGDVLVSRSSGSPHLVGSVGRVSSLNYKLILSDKTFRLIFNQNVDADFMVMAMNSRYYRQQVEQAISGAEGLANNLQLSSLRAFFFVVPSTDEQHDIVGYLGRSTNELSEAVAQAERETSLLREYRTRLIADVVTGKFDVREAAARLPDEVEELEPLDEADALIDGEDEPTDALATAP